MTTTKDQGVAYLYLPASLNNPPRFICGTCGVVYPDLNGILACYRRHKGVEEKKDDGGN